MSKTLQFQVVCAHKLPITPPKTPKLPDHDAAEYDNGYQKTASPPLPSVGCPSRPSIVIRIALVGKVDPGLTNLICQILGRPATTCHVFTALNIVEHKWQFNAVKGLILAIHPRRLPGKQIHIHGCSTRQGTPQICLLDRPRLKDAIDIQQIRRKPIRRIGSTNGLDILVCFITILFTKNRQAPLPYSQKPAPAQRSHKFVFDRTD